MVEQSDSCMLPGLATVTETLDRILSSVATLDKVSKAKVGEAAGRILAEDLCSLYDFPPWPASAMDGYALPSGSHLENASFEIVATVLAGHPVDVTVGAGQCARIMTGAPMPEGTATVEMQENCIVEGQHITLKQDISENKNVRGIGDSLKHGDVILTKGTKLGAKHLALIASSGIAEVKIYDPVNIAVFTTGDELVEPGQPLQPGQIYDSNRLVIKTMCEAMGMAVIDYGLIEDKPEKIREVMLQAAENADVLMTSGGVSVGDADHIKPVLEEVGELSQWKVAIKPGKPIAIGKINDCYFFGLPGNPVSTIVTLNQLVKPALQKLAGQEITRPQRFQAICDDKLYKRPGRMDFQRGVAYIDDSGQWYVNSTGPQGSAKLDSVTKANCYIILAADNSGVQPDDKVTIELFDHSLC